MENKRQILLPKKSFALANDEDTYITLQLNRTISDIKNEKIDNVFNLNEQYNTERQNSLKFCIYGLVESIFIDTNDIILVQKESNGLTLHSPKISKDNISDNFIAIKTFELTPDSRMSRNLYGKKKSSYALLFEIDKNELDAQDEEIRKNGGIPKTRWIEFTTTNYNKKIFFTQNVPYLFYDSEGNRINFGSQTSDVDDEGNTIEIDNDFPFLYDRHWIRQYFTFKEPSFISFTDSLINVQENVSGGFAKIKLELDQKSPFGLEEITVSIDSDNTIMNPNSDFVFTPQKIKWNKGEQFKEIPLEILNDKYVESVESLSLKFSDYIACLPKSNDSQTIKINIIDEDIPSYIRFVKNSFVEKTNVSAITISYIFDKPLEVPNQSVVLYFTPNTDAVLGKDFILDRINPSNNEITLNFKEGDISGSTTISIIDNDVYNLDKTIEFAFKNPTQNIALSNVGSVPNKGPVCIITLQESLKTLYSSFVLMNKVDKKIGAFKTPSPSVNVYGGGTNSQNQSYSNSYFLIEDEKVGLNTLNSYHIDIKNTGDDIVYQNKLIKKGDFLKTIFITAASISDIVIELPSNTSFDKNARMYKKSKYSFEFVSDESFFSKTQGSYNVPGILVENKFSPIRVDVEKDAGLSGSKRYYYTTNLNNFFLNYDKTLSACTIPDEFNSQPVQGTNSVSIDWTRVEKAYTNSLIFIGYNPLSTFNGGPNPTQQDTTLSATFEDNFISIECSQFLPFGFGKLPLPPYNFKYINVNLRNIYSQFNAQMSEYNNLKLDNSTVNSSSSNGFGFLKWSETPKNTKQSMNLSILNNGEIPVILSIPTTAQTLSQLTGQTLTGQTLTQFSAQTINPGEKFYVRGLDYDFDNFSVTLPTNESYIKSASTFNIANYILELENVTYFGPTGLPSGGTTSYRFDSTNSLVSGPLSATPRYYVVSEYNNMFVPHEGNPGSTQNPNIDCGSIDFTYFGNLKLINLAVKGVLLPNSRSSFKRGYFTSLSNDIFYTCINSNNVRIPFKKIT